MTHAATVKLGLFRVLIVLEFSVGFSPTPTPPAPKWTF